MKMKNSNQKKNVKKKLLLLLLLLLLFCVAGFGIYAVINLNSHSPADIGSTNESEQLYVNGNAVDGEAQNKTSKELLEELQKGQINVTDKLSSHIIFPREKSGTQGSWTVENSKSNNVIMQCEVSLDNKIIAKSVPIKPNQHINTITLSQDVKPGLYDVIAYINYFKLDTNEYISKAGFKVKLTVQ